MVCDVCGKPLSRADTRIVSPDEMRVIANNGYGETVSILQALPMDQRRKQFNMLTLANDTDWALCPRCWSNAQPYTAASNPSGPSVSQMKSMYDTVARPKLNEMMAAGDGGPEQAWPKLASDVAGSNPLQDAMNQYLTEAAFACPSCRHHLLYVESFNRAVSPYLGEVSEWEIPTALAPRLSEVAERLHAIKTSGFREEFTRAPVDAFECNNCDTRLSLSRAFAGQYPKPERRRAQPQSAAHTYDPPQSSGSGGGFAAFLLIAAIVAGGVYLLFVN